MNHLGTSRSLPRIHRDSHNTFQRERCQTRTPARDPRAHDPVAPPFSGLGARAPLVAVFNHRESSVCRRRHAASDRPFAPSRADGPAFAATPLPPPHHAGDVSGVAASNMTRRRIPSARGHGPSSACRRRRRGVDATTPLVRVGREGRPAAVAGSVRGPSLSTDRSNRA